jgi:hypothetical protein
MPSRVLSLRRPDTCVECHCHITAGTSAWWDAGARKVTCIACLAAGQAAPSQTLPAELDRGQPGASVGREYRRRRSNRETRTRVRHPHIGGLLLTLSKPPQHEVAFRRGEDGELSICAYLERRTARGPAVILHDRRMPMGYGNIDILAIAATGVFVIDAKNIKGDVRISNPLIGSAKLMIRGRNRTRMIDGLERQVAAVRAAVNDAGHARVPVHGVLCFTARADFPLLGGTRIRGHRLDHQRALARRLNRRGGLSPETIEQLARSLASAHRPA